MNLTWRPIELSDLEVCSRMPLADEAAYDATTRAALPRLWRELLQTGCGNSCQIEDGDQPAGERLVWFVFLVFLSDQFMAEVQGGLPPYLNRQITDRWRAGRSPLLNMAQVRAANSGPGLNMHFFHYAALPPDSYLTTVMAKCVEVYLQLCFGYNLKSTQIEVYGEMQLQLNLRGGFRLRVDHGPQADGPDHTPYLVGLTRKESEDRVGTPAAAIFTYSPPRFGFQPGEQEMLRRALFNETDEELTQSLCVSMGTVRKRWLKIYERVQAVNPHFFTAPSAEMGRGLEKRRLLLNYLRSHWKNSGRPCP